MMLKRNPLFRFSFITLVADEKSTKSDIILRILHRMQIQESFFEPIIKFYVFL